MRFRNAFTALCMTLFYSGCSAEKNPYTSGIQASEDALAINIESPDADSVPDAMGSGEENPNATSEAQTPASPESIPPALKSGFAILCMDPPPAALAEAIKNFEAEYAVLCVGGQPTATLVRAMSTPYNGTDPALLRTISNRANNTTVRLMLLSVLQIKSPVAKVIELLPSSILGSFSYNGQSRYGNISGRASQSLVSSQPRSSDPASHFMGSLATRLNVTLTVGKYRIAPTNTITDYKLTSIDQNKSLFASVGNLRVGASENSYDRLANSLNFFMSDGTETKIISVNTQEIRHQGRVDVTTSVVRAIGLATMKYGYDKLSL